MGAKGIGCVFCCIAAFLLGVRYVSAAIFMSGVASWNASLFSAGLSYVGAPLLVLSILSLLVGAAFLVCGFRKDSPDKQR